MQTETETLEQPTTQPAAETNADWLQRRVSCGPWQCFHCGETFHDVKSAEEHFGLSAVVVPMCQIFGQTVRNMENELRRYREEDTDLHRHIAHLQTEHTQALMRAEESGYAKGLKDGRELAANGTR